MNIWLIMIGGGLVTYAIRLSFIYLHGRVEIPQHVQRSLRFVPPAVMTAILVPELFLHSGRIEIGLSNERLIAGLAAILVGAWRRNVLLTIITGMTVLLILEWLG